MRSVDKKQICEALTLILTQMTPEDQRAKEPVESCAREGQRETKQGAHVIILEIRILVTFFGLEMEQILSWGVVRFLCHLLGWLCKIFVILGVWWNPSYFLGRSVNQANLSGAPPASGCRRKFNFFSFAGTLFTRCDIPVIFSGSFSLYRWRLHHVIFIFTHRVEIRQSYWPVE